MGVISKGASAPATTRVQVDCPKGTGRVRERICSLVFSPWPPGRGPPRHTFWLLICAKPLPPCFHGCLSHCSVWSSQARGCLGYAQPCAAAPSLALQTFTIHKVLKLGVFLTSQACSMTQAYSLWTACSHRKKGVTSIWNPESRGLCGLLSLKVAAHCFFQLSLLPISPVCLLVRRSENRGFLIPKQPLSWWPQSSAPPKTPHWSWHDRHLLSLPV